mgnify:CR=1 FL=1
MILRQTFKAHFISLSYTIVTTVLLLAGWWYFDFDRDYAIVAGIFHSIFTIPALYLHIEYTVRNFGEEIEITDSRIIVRKNGDERRFNSDELAMAIVYKSASIDRNGIPLTAMECYYFIRILAKNGEEIIVTSLMSRKADTAIRRLTMMPTERIKSFFCTLRWK